MTKTCLNIALVDDNADDRAVVRRLLLAGSGRRYTFVELETGSDLLCRMRGPYQGEHIDAVVCGYQLGDMTATELLRELASDLNIPPWPTVVLTGSENRERIAGLLRAGAQDYVGKSWMVPESITRALENALERHKMLTELRQRTRLLEKNEERLRLAFEAAQIGWWEWNIDADLISWSQNLEQLMGTTPAAFQGRFKALVQLVHPEDRKAFEQKVRAAIEHGTDYAHELRFVRPDGTIRWALARGKLARAVDGKQLSLGGVDIDITARRQAEDALKQAHRNKDQFIATLGHELRNPLAPIRNATHILTQLTRDSKLAAEACAILERQVTHLSRLVDDLVDITRINLGRVELQLTQVDLSAVITAASESCAPLISAKKQTLTISAMAQPLYVTGDFHRLSQVLRNILTNAAKYSHVGGSISLSLMREETHGVIRVRDNGMGIGKELLPHLFDLFTQGTRTLDKSEGGLGIGLSLVRRLVELHNGSIQAFSDGPECGSEFVVRLPLQARGSAGTKAVPVQTLDGRSLDSTAITSAGGTGLDSRYP